MSATALALFERSCQRHPQRPALWIDGRSYTYSQLLEHAWTLAALLRHSADAVSATLAERSLTAYCAPLACMIARKIHVPLGTSLPDERLLDILQRTAPGSVVCDAAGAQRLDALAGRLPLPALRIVADASGSAWQVAQAADSQDSAHAQVEAAIARAAHGNRCGLPGTDADIAYVLFTSGSTGQPKGVAVGHAALLAYIHATLARFPQLDHAQRCSQCFEPTFDLSMHDMWISWAAGACLYCVPKAALLMPHRFIVEHQLSVWFCVPTMAATLQRLGLLADNAFPSLRLSLFCGEALPAELASRWQRAAPQSRCDNLYGPTEATIACSGHRFDNVAPASAIVPIGQAHAGTELLVVDSDGVPCATGQTGELWLGGAQLAHGYWQDPVQTRARFVQQYVEGHQSRRWYRSGDLARVDAHGVVHYHGRVDRQIKLRGYRIELQDVEAQLRQACAHAGQPAEVAVLPLQAAADQPATGLVAYIVQEDFDLAATQAALRSRLPAYMIPGQFHCLTALPRNSSGKVDYPALARRQASTSQAPA